MFRYPHLIFAMLFLIYLLVFILLFSPLTEWLFFILHFVCLKISDWCIQYVIFIVNASQYTSSLHLPFVFQRYNVLIISSSGLDQSSTGIDNKILNLCQSYTRKHIWYYEYFTIFRSFSHNALRFFSFLSKKFPQRKSIKLIKQTHFFLFYCLRETWWIEFVVRFYETSVDWIKT